MASPLTPGLDVELAVLRQNATVSVASNQGKIRATAHFYHYELPKIGAWLQVVTRCDLTCAQVEEAASVIQTRALSLVQKPRNVA